MSADAADNQDQLAAIDRLSRTLADAAIEYWLFGGWAVDFWVGRVTRAHDDIDLAVWRTDEVAIDKALRRAGWLHTPDPDEDLGTRYRLGDVQLELTFLEQGARGEVIVPVPGQPAVWSEAPFGDKVRELDGVASRILPLDLLRSGKAVARPDASDAAKDVADFEALSEL